jgi:hypothetical protein
MPPEIDSTIRNSPVYWFAVMEDARQLGQFARVEQARRELARLGVRVRYDLPKPEGREAAHA